MDRIPPDDFIGIEEWDDTHLRTTVRKLFGNPTFRAIEQIPTVELEDEINRILDDLTDFRIDVDMKGIPPEEASRFLTAESMDSEIVDPPARE
jgi:hypothetical protein